MIILFRRFKQRLFTENKFTKYLLYAIGEITLVMIGILLALQVSNWNQERNQSKQEHKILVSREADFTKSKERLFDAMDMQENVVRKGSELIEMYEGKIPRVSNDTIMNYVAEYEC